MWQHPSPFLPVILVFFHIASFLVLDWGLNVRTFMLLNNANENECALNLIGNLLMTMKGMLLTSVNIESCFALRNTKNAV